MVRTPAVRSAAYQTPATHRSPAAHRAPNARTLTRATVLLSLLALLPSQAHAQAKITLRAADIQPENYPTVVGLKAMADYLKKTSNGRIELQVFSGGQLGDERSTIEQTKLGVLDIVRVSSAPIAQAYAPMGVYSLPFLFRDSTHQWKVLNGAVGKELLAGLEGAGFIGLAYYDSGTRSFYTTKKPIRTPADLKGLRIRTQQNEVVLDMMSALQARPVPLSMGEVYSSLQTSAIDGAENNYPSYGPSGARHFEVARYYSLTEHNSVPEVVMMSKVRWDKLSPADQRLIRVAAAQSVAVERKAWNALSAESRAAIQKAGVIITKVDRSAFQKAMAPVYDKYRKVYGTLIERIQDVR